MAGNDGFLYPVPSDASPNDGRLRDPTVAASAPTITGVGALLADAATISAVGLSSSTGTGALPASAAAVAGAGAIFFLEDTGSGVLVSQDAQVSGVGLSASAGTGALVVQPATSAGAGASSSDGTGSLLAQAAALASVGIAAWVLRGGYYLQEDGVGRYQLEDLSGFYLRENPDLVAQAAQVSGAGVSESTGTGALQAGDAQVGGTGTTPQPPPLPVADASDRWGGGYGRLVGGRERTSTKEKRRGPYTPVPYAPEPHRPFVPDPPFVVQSAPQTDEDDAAVMQGAVHGVQEQSDLLTIFAALIAADEL